MFETSYECGRAVLSLDFLVFTLRLIHIFEIHKQMGPKIIIVGKMVRNGGVEKRKECNIYSDQIRSRSRNTYLNSSKRGSQP